VNKTICKASLHKDKTPKWTNLKAVLTSLQKKLGISAMNVLSTIILHKFQTAIIVLLSLVMCGQAVVYRQQAETQIVLNQLISNEVNQHQTEQEIEQLISILKSIQTTQAEQSALLARLAATQPEPNKVPASKMKKFKQGAYKSAKATGY
jgi:hypothetical protein